MCTNYSINFALNEKHKKLQAPYVTEATFAGDSYFN